MKAVIDSQVSGNTMRFQLDGDLFVLNNPIVINAVGSTIVQQIIIEGVEQMDRQTTAGAGTTIQPSASFPTNRYMFESIATVASNLTPPSLIIRNLSCPNNLHAADGINVGFIRYESDVKRNHKLFLERLHLQYMWRGIHLVGGIWWGKVRDIWMQEANSSFVGDAFIILEDGTHANASNPSPKECSFDRISLTNGGGVFNDAIRIQSGGYNRFTQIDVNGQEYETSVINLNNIDALTIHNNTFDNFQVIDTNAVPSPDNRKGTLYMSGTSTYDNIFRNCRIVNYPVAVLLDSTGTKNNLIEISGFFGTTPIVSDTNTASSLNTIRIQGNGTSANPVKITHTGGFSRIIDTRQGAEKAGFTSVADGGTITHGLMTTPLWVMVTPSIASEMASVTAKSSTTFTVALKKHDNTAGTTQSVYWRAGLYA